MIKVTVLSSADFLQLTLQEVADLLADKLEENLEKDKEYSCAKLHGKINDQLYELDIIMRGIEDD